MSFRTMNNPKMSQENSSHSPRQRLTPPKEEEPKNHNIKSKPPHRQPIPRRCKTLCPKAHENTEGSHPCDAKELKQQEESREDPGGDSAMNNNAVLNDNARRTNEVEPDNSLLTPREEQSTPSAIPSPEGTQKKAEDGEDPTADEADGTSGKPFFNLSAETLYMNPLNPGMISLAPWVCGVDRLSDANTYHPSPNPDGSVRLNLLDSPQNPSFHLHLSTRHKHHAHIRYGDIRHPHTSLQWALNKVDGTVQVAAVRTTLRFEVARHLLLNFTVSSPKELSEKSKRELGEYRRRHGKTLTPVTHSGHVSGHYGSHDLFGRILLLAL